MLEYKGPKHWKKNCTSTAHLFFTHDMKKNDTKCKKNPLLQYKSNGILYAKAIDCAQNI